MPSSVICHNYALPGVTWLDLNDSDTLAPLLCLSQMRGGGGGERNSPWNMNVKCVHVEKRMTLLLRVTAVLSQDSKLFPDDIFSVTFFVNCSI